MEQTETRTTELNIECSCDRTLGPEQVQRLLRQTEWADERDISGIRDMLANSFLTLGVWDGDRLIGFARVLSDGHYRALIDDVVVDEAYRGKGIGTRLMKHLLANLEQVEEVFLRTGGETSRFYERFGFVMSRGTTMDWGRYPRGGIRMHTREIHVAKTGDDSSNGSDYLPHTPQNPERPGWYFHPLCGVNSWIVNGREMIVWGNYCNVLGGASPVNIYYSINGGHTVKIAYAFGQNPYFRDDGSEGGGRTGMLLGNPDNPVKCRHVHCVAYNPVEDAFYACTGDGDRDDWHECHWLRGTYDAQEDAWDWIVVVSERLNSRYKAGGINFVDGQLYWISDANGPLPYDRGIFRCDPADLTNPEAHTLLYNPEVESGNMIIQDGVILASHCAPASPLNTGFIVSSDMGQTWAQYDLEEFGKRSPVRFHEKNSEGWFRVDLRSGWIGYAEVLFIKPKEG